MNIILYIIDFLKKIKKTIKNIKKYLVLKLEYNPNTYIKVDSLYELINNNLDITKFPQATGNLRQIQLKVLDLLINIKNICEQNNLCYWLDFGTLLGAVRHKGFIPWDADADISMIREDYLKLIPILKQFFANSDFIVREFYGGHCQLRIQDKNNIIGIDIFPVDYLYIDKNLNNEEKFKLNNKIKNANNLFRAYTSFNTIFKIYKNEKNRSIISNITKEKILNKKDNINTEKDKTILFYGIDYPHDNDNFNPIEYNIVFPLDKIEFEDVFFYCPNQIDTYLKTLYGNYMKFPKQIAMETQVKHFLSKQKKEL